MKFKYYKFVLTLIGAVFILLCGCTKQEVTESNGVMWVGNSPETNKSKSPYLINLENLIENKDHTFTWIWSVSNLHPGSGAPGSGTVQDLISWGITLGSCTDINQIVYGSTSSDGITWTNFEPAITVETQLPGFAKPVLMFDQGTVNDQKSFYKLVILPKLSTTPDIIAIYKSGTITGSGTFTIQGFGCPTY